MLMRLDAGQASQPPGIRLDKMKESSKDVSVLWVIEVVNDQS